MSTVMEQEAETSESKPEQKLYVYRIEIPEGPHAGEEFGSPMHDRVRQRLIRARDELEASSPLMFQVPRYGGGEMQLKEVEEVVAYRARILARAFFLCEGSQEAGRQLVTFAICVWSLKLKHFAGIFQAIPQELPWCRTIAANAVEALKPRHPDQHR